jgi:hypothetical protein
MAVQPSVFRRAADQNLRSHAESENNLDHMTTLLGVNLKQRIGSTPLLRFEQLTKGLVDVQVLSKAEWTNPGGSVIVTILPDSGDSN